MDWKNLISLGIYKPEIISTVKYLEKHNPNFVDLFINIYKIRIIVNLSIQSNKEHSTREERLKWEREASLAISVEALLNICSVQARQGKARQGKASLFI